MCSATLRMRPDVFLPENSLRRIQIQTCVGSLRAAVFLGLFSGKEDIEKRLETHLPKQSGLLTLCPCEISRSNIWFVIMSYYATHSPVAQLVERRTVNPFVVGSSPTGGAFETLRESALVL